MRHSILFLVLCLGCARGLEDDIEGGGRNDGAPDDEGASDTGGAGDDTGGSGDDTGGSGDDTGATTDTTVVTADTGPGVDTGTTVDTGSIDTGTPVVDTGPAGPISGGPCTSGAKGATAFRVRFYNGGGKPTVMYDVWGLPDKSRQKVGVYGYTIPYTVPAWADPFLGEGGLQLDSSNFIDIELSTKSLSSITSVTLSLYGRSYNTTASGSFNWQTFTSTGATPSGSVSNAAPYKWYPGNATAAFVTGDGGVLLRIKAGGPSGSLVVNKIELCMEAS